MRYRTSSRSVEQLDDWLEACQLYRKPVAKDASCLFRAVAELVLSNQASHAGVRELCITYMTHNKEEFTSHISGSIDDHIAALRDPHTAGGSAELFAVAQIFKAEVLLYQDSNICNASNNHPRRSYSSAMSSTGVASGEVDNSSFIVATCAPKCKPEKQIKLALVYGNHYDVVYTKKQENMRAYCQSLLYERLYSDVYGMHDIEGAVMHMLHDNTAGNMIPTLNSRGGPAYPPLNRHDSSGAAQNAPSDYHHGLTSDPRDITFLMHKLGIKGTEEDSNNISSESSPTPGLDDAVCQDTGNEDSSPTNSNCATPHNEKSALSLLRANKLPFPYRVAKSLDPNIYRNIEYDVWQTEKKDSGGGPNRQYLLDGLQTGAKVRVRLNAVPFKDTLKALREKHLRNRAAATTLNNGNNSIDAKTTPIDGEALNKSGKVDRQNCNSVDTDKSYDETADCNAKATNNCDDLNNSRDNYNCNDKGEDEGEYEEEYFHGIIQSLSENKGPVNVYIEEIASKIDVPYKALEAVVLPSPGHSPYHLHHHKGAQTPPLYAPPSGNGSYNKHSTGAPPQQQQANSNSTGYYKQQMNEQYSGNRKRSRHSMSRASAPPPGSAAGGSHLCSSRGGGPVRRGGGGGVYPGQRYAGEDAAIHNNPDTAEDEYHSLEPQPTDDDPEMGEGERDPNSSPPLRQSPHGDGNGVQMEGEKQMEAEADDPIMGGEEEELQGDQQEQLEPKSLNCETPIDENKSEENSNHSNGARNSLSAPTTTMQQQRFPYHSTAGGGQQYYMPPPPRYHHHHYYNGGAMQPSSYHYQPHYGHYSLPLSQQQSDSSQYSGGYGGGGGSTYYHNRGGHHRASHHNAGGRYYQNNGSGTYDRGNSTSSSTGNNNTVPEGDAASPPSHHHPAATGRRGGGPPTRGRGGALHYYGGRGRGGAGSNVPSSYYNGNNRDQQQQRAAILPPRLLQQQQRYNNNGSSNGSRSRESSVNRRYNNRSRDNSVNRKRGGNSSRDSSVNRRYGSRSRENSVNRRPSVGGNSQGGLVQQQQQQYPVYRQQQQHYGSNNTHHQYHYQRQYYPSDHNNDRHGAANNNNNIRRSSYSSVGSTTSVVSASTSSTVTCYTASTPTVSSTTTTADVADNSTACMPSSVTALPSDVNTNSSAAPVAHASVHSNDARTNTAAKQSSTSNCSTAASTRESRSTITSMTTAPPVASKITPVSVSTTGCSTTNSSSSKDTPTTCASASTSATTTTTSTVANTTTIPSSSHYHSSSHRSASVSSSSSAAVKVSTAYPHPVSYLNTLSGIVRNRFEGQPLLAMGPTGRKAIDYSIFAAAAGGGGGANTVAAPFYHPLQYQPLPITMVHGGGMPQCASAPPTEETLPPPPSHPTFMYPSMHHHHHPMAAASYPAPAALPPPPQPHPAYTQCMAPGYAVPSSEGTELPPQQQTIYYPTAAPMAASPAAPPPPDMTQACATPYGPGVVLHYYTPPSSVAPPQPQLAPHYSTPQAAAPSTFPPHYTPHPSPAPPPQQSTIGGAGPAPTHHPGTVASAPGQWVLTAAAPGAPPAMYGAAPPPPPPPHPHHHPTPHHMAAAHVYPLYQPHPGYPQPLLRHHHPQGGPPAQHPGASGSQYTVQ